MHTPRPQRRDELSKRLQACAHEFFREYLERANGNVTKAAKLAGLNRTHWYWAEKSYNFERKKRNVQGNAAWLALGDE